MRVQAYLPQHNFTVRPRPDLVGRSCDLVAAVPAPRASSRCTTVEIGRWAQGFGGIADRPATQSTRTVTVIWNELRCTNLDAGGRSQQRPDDGREASGLKRWVGAGLGGDRGAQSC